MPTIRCMAQRRVDLDSAELARRYEAGESIRQLAVAYDTSYGTVHSRLDDAGVQFRDRGSGPRRGPGRRRPPALATAR